MALTSNEKGVFAIAPTPFLPDGAVDWKSIDRMTDFYTACGVDGLTILGIMGEAHKLEAAEALRIVETITGRFDGKIVVGVSAPGFAAMTSLTKAAMDMGADGVMIAPPPALRTDEQIVGYYAQAIEQIGDDVPFVLQDHPQATTVKMSNGVIRRIVENHSSCVMLKHEDWPGLEKISALRNWQANGVMREISILVGNGGLFLDFEMERGADGAMTGYAFPEMLIDVVSGFQNGEPESARALFDAHLPLLRYEHQPVIGLSVRKHVLMRRGVIAHDVLRAPAPSLSDSAIREIEGLLGRLGRTDQRANL
ncbi:dihydrodipicolinate synthase family protein [Notoacmeibacter sp. MSK16QG-6]|uniref:dihydrodipicolinate synthase family protein n=1 Tax=Notoacmeibacter sp. MSK16QG-6 TaxID=2957982 RepID=UPI00209DF455|nr:dihydrodipicolinate synthase family protein [Notoacmeibacter sp. MSK16QG-6]MCP1199550.1 dihydrodipicolinate synthase family protein [Notoacmeibacter sp. MSK16QG-6]